MGALHSILIGMEHRYCGEACPQA